MVSLKFYSQQPQQCMIKHTHSLIPKTLFLIISINDQRFIFHHPCYPAVNMQENNPLLENGTNV